MNRMQKIGLFGGSFNPLHCGHVAMARAFADELALDSVLFVPAGNPYHKAHADVGREHRWQMVQCVTELDARFAASDVDLVREGKTYTIDTVQIFKQIYPGAQWWWLMGMDSFMTLHTWKHWQALVRQVSIAVAARPGQSLRQLPAVLQGYAADALKTGSLHFLNAPEMAVSSTEIRRKIQAGADISNDVPSAVRQYILQHGLYREYSR